MTDKRISWTIPWLVFLFTFVAFFLRLYRIDIVSLRGDEAFTVNFVQRTWEGLWKGISTIEPNPPLAYLPLRAWIAVFDDGEFETRFFSLIFGVLCVPLLYRLAREMFGGQRGRIIGAIAAALIAINPYQIWHSQDVRNYTMWPALSLLGLVFFWRWWKIELEFRDRVSVKSKTLALTLTLYILATLASLYTHYYDVFILAALNAFVFLLACIGKRWKTLARWIGAQIVLVICYAPWVLFGTDRITNYGEASAETGTSLNDIFSRTIAAFATGDTVPEIVKTFVWLPLTLVLVLVLIYLARQNRRIAIFFVFWISVPVLAIYIVSIGRPLFLERYLNGIAPAFYLAFAVGINAFRNTQYAIRNVSLGAIAIIIVGISDYSLANYYFDPAYAKAPNWRDLVKYIVDHRQPGDIVVQNFTDDSISYYRQRLMPPMPAGQQPGCINSIGYLPVITLPKSYWANAEDEAQTKRVNAECQRIWFIPAIPDWWDQSRFVENYLRRYADRELYRDYPPMSVELYLTPQTFQPKIIPVNARIGNAILVGYRLSPASVSTNSILHVSLYWRAAQKIDKDLTVFVHLADANDQLIAQQDSTPVYGTNPTSQWQPNELVIDGYDLKVNGVPGKYTLIIGMYDSTVTRAPAFDANGNRLSNDRVLLTSITITQ
jgi:4-amino-4-deoxy-L-arabinose transferase-like glycosyltransferase